MTPYDYLFKILSRFKAYGCTFQEAIHEITETFLTYPGFTPEAKEDFLKWLNEPNAKKPLDTTQVPEDKEFPNDL